MFLGRDFVVSENHEVYLLGDRSINIIIMLSFSSESQNKCVNLCRSRNEHSLDVCNFIFSFHEMHNPLSIGKTPQAPSRFEVFCNLNTYYLMHFLL